MTRITVIKSNNQPRPMDLRPLTQDDLFAIAAAHARIHARETLKRAAERTAPKGP